MKESMTQKKDVIINIYTESSELKSHKNLKPSKKNNNKTFSRPTTVPRSRLGYDRRAQMLAYAQELRQYNVQQIQRPFRVNFRPKPTKKWRWSLSLQKIRLLFSRFRGTDKEWKYEQIVTEDCGDVDQIRIKRTSSKCSNFTKKLKCFLKDIAKSCKCNGTCSD